MRNGNPVSRSSNPKMSVVTTAMRGGREARRRSVAALRFFYVKTLKRRYLLEDIPRPKRYRKLPEVLSPEEVAQLIDSASNLFHRTMLMTLYSNGIRRAELCRLQVTDIDSQRMMVHI